MEASTPDVTNMIGTSWIYDVKPTDGSRRDWQCRNFGTSFDSRQATSFPVDAEERHRVLLSMAKEYWKGKAAHLRSERRLRGRSWFDDLKDPER